MRRAAGFTLLEVLVALALVATVLGGVLGLVREAIASQAHLERRQVAEWAASNVLAQYLLEHRGLVADKREGVEEILGRRLQVRLVVRELPQPPRESLRQDPDAPEVTPPQRFGITVDVRDGGRRAAPLARLYVERETRSPE